MPKPGYYSLTIKEKNAERFLEIARKNGLGVVDFFEKLADHLPEVELDYVLEALKNAQLFKLADIAVSEAVKHNLSFLFYGFDAILSDWSEYTEGRVFPAATTAEGRTELDTLDLQLHDLARYLRKILDHVFTGWHLDVAQPDFHSPPYAPSDRDYLELLYVREISSEELSKLIWETREGLRHLVQDMSQKFSTILKFLNYVDNEQIRIMVEALKSILSPALAKLAEETRPKPPITRHAKNSKNI